MHSFDILKYLAFAGAVNAVQFSNANYNIVASQPFDITWTGNNGPVTIFLKNGDPADLKTVSTVVSGAQGNSFTWIPSASLTNDQYVLEIEDDGQADPNYSPQFQYSGGVAPLPSTTSMTTAMMTSMTLSTSAIDAFTANASITSVPIVSNSSVAAVPNASSNSTMTMTMTPSSTLTSATGTSARHSSTTATGSRTSESATPIKSGDTSAAGHLTNPIAFILISCGFLAFFI